MHYAYQYILANEGLDTSSGYPYRGRVSRLIPTPLTKLLTKPCSLSLSFQQSSCYYNSDYKGVEISGSIQIKNGDEYSLMAAVASAGPVAVGVDASSKAFRVREQEERLTRSW